MKWHGRGREVVGWLGVVECGNIVTMSNISWTILLSFLVHFSYVRNISVILAARLVYCALTELCFLFDLRWLMTFNCSLLSGFCLLVFSLFCHIVRGKMRLIERRRDDLTSSSTVSKTTTLWTWNFYVVGISQHQQNPIHIEPAELLTKILRTPQKTCGGESRNFALNFRFFVKSTTRLTAERGWFNPFNVNWLHNSWVAWTTIRVNEHQTGLFCGCKSHNEWSKWSDKRNQEGVRWVLNSTLHKSTGHEKWAVMLTIRRRFSSNFLSHCDDVWCFIKINCGCLNRNSRSNIRKKNVVKFVALSNKIFLLLWAHKFTFCLRKLNGCDTTREFLGFLNSQKILERARLFNFENENQLIFHFSVLNDNLWKT